MRLHPLSAVGEAAGLAASGAIAGSLLAGVLPEFGLPVDQAAVLALLGVLAGSATAVARYMAFDYELDDGRLVVRSGVVRRRQREIPLGRVQTVDVSQPVLARLVGLASVGVETAGGGATEAQLSYVTVQEAERLKDALQERGTAASRGAGAAEAATGTGAAGAAGAPPGERRGEVLFRLSTHDLVVLGLVSFRWGAVPLMLLSAPVVGSLLVSFALDVLRAMESGFATAIAALLVGLGGVVAMVLAGWLISSVTTVVRYYGFTLRRDGDELRYERGLLERYSGAIPLDKVQTLTVEENVLMRPLGYAALTVETAGYAGGGNGDRGGGRAPSAVPLAAREEVLGLVESLAGVDDLAVEQPPERARRRYVTRYALVLVGLTGLLLAARLAIGAPRAWFGPLVALPLAPVAGRLKWRHRGYRVDDDQFLTRAGYWRRATRIVPHYRLQTVVERRTVFQRRWGLADVTADTASAASLLGGDATAHDRDADDAGRLHRTLRDHLQTAIRQRRAGRGARIGGDVDAMDDHDAVNDADVVDDADATEDVDTMAGADTTDGADPTDDADATSDADGPSDVDGRSDTDQPSDSDGGSDADGTSGPDATNGTDATNRTDADDSGSPAEKPADGNEPMGDGFEDGGE